MNNKDLIKELNVPLLDEEWFDYMIEDCKAIITQRVKNSREELMRGYYELGIRLLKENDNFKRSGIYGKEIVQRVGESLGISKTTIYNSMQFAKQFITFEDVYKLDEGENISWKKLTIKYLPDNPPIEEQKTERVIVCPACGYHIHEYEFTF